jgi:hypothetical protein
MPSDSSGQSPRNLPRATSKSTGRDRFEAATAEHVLIEGDEFENDIAHTPPRIPQQRFLIKNRSHALETELTLFEGGWISVRQHRRSKPGEAQLIHLQFLDPKPEVTRYFSRRSMHATIALGVLGIGSGILVYLSQILTVSVPATIAFLFASGVTFATCAYRTQKRVTFYTRHGRAPIIALLATLGSFRELRRIVPDISRAIEESAASAPTDRARRLRSEMREHYRLRESGIITEKMCGDCTQRILDQFE